MTLQKQLMNHAKIAGTVATGLLAGIVAIPNAAVAQFPNQPYGMMDSSGTTQRVIPLSQIRVADRAPYPQNPCPSVYYEYPFNQRVVVPQTCPSNAITQRLDNLGLLPTVRENAIRRDLSIPTAPATPSAVPAPAY